MSMGMGIEMGSSSPSSDVPGLRENPSDLPRRRKFRPGPPDEVFIPVAPMLDMAFQLLAFFIMTFRPPTAETHVDLYLPVAAVAMPSKTEGQVRGDSARIEVEIENDLLIRAEADELGDLKSLRLGDAPLPDAAALGDRLRRYAQILGNQPLRVRIAADDRLRFEPAARIIAACSAAGVSSLRLAMPGGIPLNQKGSP